MVNENWNSKVEYKWGIKHGIILSSFLLKLKNNNIRYIILRNFEGLPEHNDSKDVDIIIAPGSYKTASKLLLATFREQKVSNYYVVKYERVRCWLGMDLSSEFSIHIDLIEGYLNKGFEIFDFEILYKNTEQYKDFIVLNKKFDAIMLLLYKVIGCKELKEKYRKKISTIYTQSMADINKILLSVLGQEYGKRIIRWLEIEDYESIVDNASTISKRTKVIAFKARPVYTAINILKFLTEKFYRIIWCPKKYKKFFAVEAPDGTGKTTFIEGLCEVLAEMYVTDIEKMHVCHFRPTILPNLGAVGEKAGVMEQDKDFTNPHRNKPSNPLSSFVRMSYYWIDYVFGGLAYVRKDVQFDKFLIFDRYIYDFIVDPLRSRINLPRFMRCTFAKFVPQPHIVFVLTADAKTIYNRKKELTIEEIERQLKEFNRLADSHKRFIKLDASRIPSEIIKDAIQILINRYTFKVD